MRLEMYRGKTAVFDFECKQSDGSALDVTAGSLWFTVKSSTRQSDADAILQKTNDDGISLVNPSGGLAKVVIIPSDTSGQYAPSELVWDLTYTPVLGQAFLLISGPFILKADVTNSLLSS